MKALGIMVCIYALAELLRYVNLRLDDRNSKSPIQYVLIGVCILLWFLSLPVALVLGGVHYCHCKRLQLHPISQAKDAEISSLKSTVISQKSEISELRNRISHYDALIESDRKRCREEGYKAGRLEASAEYDRRREYDEAYFYKSGYLDGQADYPLGINRMDE